MRLFDSIFSIFLTREQRERHSRTKWEKSVEKSAREMGLDSKQPQYVAPTTPTQPTLAPINTECPMTPSLSSASSSSSPPSGLNSPTPSRPSTSYSTSPRPEFRRHTSIQRNPISYDALITAKPEKPRRSSSDSAPQTQLLYPCPPIGPMEGFGKYRRSVHVTEGFMQALERDTIAALQPFSDIDEDRVSRFRRREYRDTTTPPRAYSTSPPQEHIQRQQLAMQTDLTRWTQELEAASESEGDYEDVPASSGEITRASSRPVRVASRRRGQNSRERRGQGARVTAAVVAARKQGVRPMPPPVSGLTKNLKGKQQQQLQAYRPKAVSKEAAMAASMETLISGE